MLTRFIAVKTRFEGIHQYPEAQFKSELQDVKFLGYPHRHMFHIQLVIEVSHNNRDIEFIQCKRWLESQFKEDIIQLNYKSCEMIGEEIVEAVRKKYPDSTYIRAEVFEDGENGALVVWYPTEVVK